MAALRHAAPQLRALTQGADPAVRCAIGLHRWSRWTYPHDGECRQVRRCLRCGLEGSRVSHAGECVVAMSALLQQAYEQWATDAGARDKTYYAEVDRIRAEGSLFRCTRCGVEWREAT